MELIVTADDFGYSPRRDDTIIDCFVNGILTGTSLMVNGKTAVEAVKKAQKVGLPLGLHFNISEGVPISDPATIPTLITSKAGVTQFHGKEGFIYAEENGTISVNDVERELRAQLDRFISLVGIHPDYVDGHQHVHMYPRFADRIATVFEEYGIHRTRFPSEDMDEVGWMNTNPRKPFRQRIHQNTIKSRPIYCRHGVYGGYGIGSSIGGNTMSVQRILNCCLRYPCSASSITTLELMTHPGAPEQEPSLWGCGTGADGFSQSPEREFEYRILTDRHLPQYLQDKQIKLCSYAESHIGLNQWSGERQSRVVMMLSLKEGTGNTITGIRVASHLKASGYVVQMVDTTDSFATSNLLAILSNPDYSQNSDLVSLFCIHALRAGVFAAETDLPFILMMGGTDINVSAGHITKGETVKRVLQRAAHIIAFTEDMKKRAASLIGQPCPPITVISQSAEKPEEASHMLRDILELSSSDQLLILPSGIRPIKDIHHVLDSFSTYHESHPHAHLCIIGPVLDKEYADSLFARIPEDHIRSFPANYSFSKKRDPSHLLHGVNYVAPVPHSDFMKILMDVDAVVNTSISEGLAAVLLESASAGKIIIARNNPGNASVIVNGVNGLLYDTPEEFILLVDKILAEPIYKQTLENSARQYYEDSSLFEKEREQIRSILESICNH